VPVQRRVAARRLIQKMFGFEGTLEVFYVSVHGIRPGYTDHESESQTVSMPVKLIIITYVYDKMDKRRRIAPFRTCTAYHRVGHDNHIPNSVSRF